MYEDTPQELVHDLISRGGLRQPPARAAGDRHRRGDLVGLAARDPGLPPLDVHARRTSSSRPRGTSSTTGSSSSSQRVVDRRDELADGEAARAAAARAHAEARPALPAQGHRAVPRLPRRARRLALRPAALRRVDPRRDPRRLGVVAPLPGDPREARHGLRRLQLPLASTPTPARSGSTSARARTTSPSALAIAAEQIADIAGGGLRESELERAKENLKGRVLLSMESTSTHMNRLGKSLITDSEILSLERIVAEVDAVEPEAVARARRRCCSRPSGSRPRASGRARSGSSRRSKASRRRSRARRESPPQRLFAALARDGQGRRGARAAASSRPATRSSRPRPRPTRWSTSRRRTPSCPNILRAVAAGVPCVVGTTGWDTAEVDGAAREAGVAGLLRAELRDRRRADDALRRRGVGATSTAAEIVELHHATKLDAPSGHGEGDRGRDARATCRSTRCGCRASSRTRR